MKIKISVLLAISVLIAAGLAFSEEQGEIKPTTMVAPQAANDSNTQWVWGEVTVVDAQNKTLTLKYLDYEADQEKEIALTIDDTASYENVKALEDIQPKDNLSVDYITKDGKNIAKSISLEKAEDALSTDKPETGSTSLEPRQPNVSNSQTESGTQKPGATSRATQ